MSIVAHKIDAAVSAVLLCSSAIVEAQRVSTRTTSARLTLWIAAGFFAVTLPSAFYRLGESQPRSLVEGPNPWVAVNIVGQFVFVVVLIALAVNGVRRLEHCQTA